MTQQTNGTPELKYSEEIFRDLYEALKDAVADIEKTGYTSVSSATRMQRALARAEGK